MAWSIPSNGHWDTLSCACWRHVCQNERYWRLRWQQLYKRKIEEDWEEPYAWEELTFTELAIARIQRQLIFNKCWSESQTNSSRAGSRIPTSWLHLPKLEHQGDVPSKWCKRNNLLALLDSIQHDDQLGQTYRASGEKVDKVESFEKIEEWFPSNQTRMQGVLECDHRRRSTTSVE